MRWEEMPKGHMSVAELVRQFETQCRLEGKPDTTCRWYREILEKFLEWAGEVCPDEFNLDKMRGYLGFLKDRPRYAGHPTTPSNGEKVSAYTFRHHTVGLRVFARWLRDEGYTSEHRLERLRTPQVPETLVEVLTPRELERVLESESPNTANGSRNYAMLVLALDTGLRMSEITRLERRNLDLDQGFLRAFGKGSKERIVPFGYTSTKALQRYLLHFRPKPALPQYDYVFLQRNGCPLAKGAMVTRGPAGCSRDRHAAIDARMRASQGERLHRITRQPLPWQLAEWVIKLSCLDGDSESRAQATTA